MTRSKSAPRPSAAPGRRRIRGLDADQRSAQRRRQLLNSATDLFARQGFSGTSIEQICQHAYVGTKGFYDHFDSKEACYIALLEQITAQIQQRVTDAALAQAQTPWPQRATAVIVAFVHAITDDPRLALASFGEAGGVSSTVERRRRQNRRWAADFLDRQWAGEPDPDPERQRGRSAVALATIGGLFELILDWLERHDDGGTPAAVQTLTEDLIVFFHTVDAGRHPVG